MTLDERLEQIVLLLGRLVEQQNGRDREWYSTEEFARLVGRTPLTVREWCRLGRIQAEKQTSGRGAFPAWIISNEELLRYRREGLRPAAGRRQES